MRVQEIMTARVVSIGPDEPAQAAWLLMEREGIRHLVVMEGKRLLGVLSDRDLGGRKGGAARKGRTVRELMTPRVAVATPGTTLRQAANVMRGRLIGCLPVVDDGRVVGIATATDVLEELGRGSSRPAVKAQRRAVRLPPASTRTARREGARKREPKAVKRATKAGKASAEPSEGRGRDLPTTPAARRRIAPALGRHRVRTPDSPTRAPLPARIARAEKRAVGRTADALPPAHIRSLGSELGDDDRKYLRRKLGRKLGKFASSIERTSVRVEDVNGPRGGVDKRCRIKVVLSGLPSVVVDERQPSLQAALDRALERVGRAVRERVHRRSTAPTRRRGADKRASLPR
jgi:predicted transcriptional regulator/ribosome-associated translation inhibitor RaiA